MKCRIIVYHNPRYDVLSRAIAMCKEQGFNIVSIDELSDWLHGFTKVLPAYDNILFTFDDKPSQHLELLKFEPELRRKFCCYHQFDWNDQIEWSYCQELRDCGVTIGAHTITHHDLVKMTSPLDVERELGGAQLIFSRKMDFLPRHMATPYGHNNEMVMQAAQRSNYLTVRAVGPGCVMSNTNPLDLPSYSAYQDILIDEYKNVDIAIEEFRALLNCRNGQFYDQWVREPLKKRGYIK